MTVLLSALQRSITTQCDKSTEGNSHYNSSQTDMVWICRGGGGESGYHTGEECTVHTECMYTLLTFTPSIHHLPYKLTVLLGTTQDNPGTSCKHILEFLSATCNKTQIDGPDWTSLRDECPRKEQTIQVNTCLFYHG